MGYSNSRSNRGSKRRTSRLWISDVGSPRRTSSPPSADTGQSTRRHTLATTGTDTQGNVHLHRLRGPRHLHRLPRCAPGASLPPRASQLPRGAIGLSFSRGLRVLAVRRADRASTSATGRCRSMLSIARFAFRPVRSASSLRRRPRGRSAVPRLVPPALGARRTSRHVHRASRSSPAR